MFKNFLKKNKKENLDNKNILIVALLIHAAKIENNYTENEKTIIKKVIMELDQMNSSQASELLTLAEKKRGRI